MEDPKTPPGADTPVGDSAEDSNALDSYTEHADGSDSVEEDTDGSDSIAEDSGSSDAPDLTLGGYQEAHERPPAFTGSDGEPYTASIEIESVDNLAAPYVAYLVFPQWAGAGLGIVGHVETPVLCEGRSRSEVQEEIDALRLSDVKRLLDEAIQRKTEEA